MSEWKEINTMPDKGIFWISFDDDVIAKCFCYQGRFFISGTTVKQPYGNPTHWKPDL